VTPRSGSLPVTVRLLPEPMSAGVPRSGAVASIQEAQLSVPRDALERSWRPAHLERLARSYWRFLGRISLGLLRVVYAPESRTVVLLFPAFPLLRFGVPEYVARPTFGQVTWPIRGGLLVAREGRERGFLRIRIWHEGRDPASQSHEVVRASVEVQNFYPWLRGSGWCARLGTWLYQVTQLRIHALITRGFLRSLARLDLGPAS
jgi:hypothetical protein